MLGERKQTSNSTYCITPFSKILENTNYSEKKQWLPGLEAEKGRVMANDSGETFLGDQYVYYFEYGDVFTGI